MDESIIWRHEAIEYMIERATQTKPESELLEYICVFDGFKLLFETLNDRMQLIVWLRYSRSLKLSAIGEILGITPSRVQKLEAKALCLIKLQVTQIRYCRSNPLPATIPLKELRLRDRTYHCLRRSNIKTIDELTEQTDSDLLSITNFGISSLDEVESKLAERGLTLKRP